MELWRLIILISLLSLSVIDLSATYYYVNTYKTWQPNKSFNLIENNPFLVFLWNTFGLKLGMVLGAIIILALIFIIGKTSHPIVLGIIFLIYAYALFNHYTNITLLHNLIIKYPMGII